MTKQEFFEYIILLETISTVLNNELLDKLATLISLSFKFSSSVEQKIKYFIHDCSFGKQPKEYYMNNGRIPILLSSKQKLWEFIHE